VQGKRPRQQQSHPPSPLSQQPHQPKQHHRQQQRRKLERHHIAHDEEALPQNGGREHIRLQIIEEVTTKPQREGVVEEAVPCA
jgi:hypothetical protein